MWVFIQSKRPTRDTLGLWSVGHYDPLGMWVSESKHDYSGNASARCNYINGGLDDSALERIISALKYGERSEI